jgi:hypothetical protein
LRKTLKSTDVVAEREYQLSTRRGKKKVRVRFGKPLPLPTGAGAYCVYEIDGLEPRRRSDCSFGVDGVQALFNAMYMAWAYLVSTDAYQEGRLAFFGVPVLGLSFVIVKQGATPRTGQSSMPSKRDIRRQKRGPM